MILNAQYMLEIGFFQWQQRRGLEVYWNSAEQATVSTIRIRNFYEKGLAVPQNYILAYMRIPWRHWRSQKLIGTRERTLRRHHAHLAPRRCRSPKSSRANGGQNSRAIRALLFVHEDSIFVFKSCQRRIFPLISASAQFRRGELECHGRFAWGCYYLLPHF